jgi:hypothetical protein
MDRLIDTNQAIWNELWEYTDMLKNKKILEN